MKVFICYSRDRQADALIADNERAGNKVYEEDGCLFVDIYSNAKCYTAPDARQQQYVSSGIYRFDEKGRPFKVS